MQLVIQSRSTSKLLSSSTASALAATAKKQSFGCSINVFFCNQQKRYVSKMAVSSTTNASRVWTATTMSREKSAANRFVAPGNRKKTTLRLDSSAERGAAGSAESASGGSSWSSWWSSKWFSPQEWFSWYCGVLDTHPLLTKSLTAGIVAGTGDMLCQFITSNAEFSPDWPRTGRFAFLVGALAPTTHYWYAFLMKTSPSPTIANAVGRSLADQTIYMPTYLLVFLVSLWTWEGEAHLQKRLREEVPPCLKTQFMVWVPAQVINFGFVHGRFQVLFANCVSLGWTSFLSYRTQLGKNCSRPGSDGGASGCNDKNNDSD